MDSDEILALLMDTAAEVITPRFRSLTSQDIAQKDPGDLVTVADREAEVIITAALRDRFPAAVVVGEEATAADPAIMDAFSSAEHAFTVDPLDGTKNFVEGSPDYAVMVAELRGGRPVRSWIWQPEAALAYVAESGGGVWRNGVRLEPVSPTRAHDTLPRGATSVSLRTAPKGLAALTTPPWSAGMAHLAVLTGQLDFVLFRKDWPWDHVPGVLMATELAGRVGRLDGTPYDPRRRQGWLLSASTTQMFETARGPLREALDAGGHDARPTGQS